MKLNMTNFILIFIILLFLLMLALFLFWPLIKKNVLKSLNKDHNFLEIYDERINDFVYYLNDKFFNKINGKFIEIPFNKDFNDCWITQRIFKFYDVYDDDQSIEKYPKYIISINCLKNFKYREKYRTDWDLSEKLHNFCEKNKKTRYYVENL